MPIRAHWGCLPLRRASAFGWHLFPPIRFSLMWNGGSELLWAYAGAENWLPLHVAHIPGFPTLFDRAAPFELRPFAPPFLVALGQTGIVQVWTGLFAQSVPGWKLLIRSPANAARSKSYEIFESLLDMQGRLSPLFMKIHVLRTNAPIEFDPDSPVAQLQPLQSAIAESAFDDFKVIAGIEKFTAADWADFRNAVAARSSYGAKVTRSSRADVRSKAGSKRLLENRRIWRR